ncbi:MAG: antitoxin VapB family protein [Nitrososphaerota archaeon]|nr:antitoxin VapB family protein [Nitrososphaerota archaeon]MDG7018519.1 antitoxin VapB family protein [Nitrososphaerota archaeon]MDG7019984.1 antitoxin VapB family protein [Nitrososphaerota archaeon]
MGHKTITISDGAYDALAKSRLTNESFTKVILRLTTGKGSARMLLQHVKSSASDEELALRVEAAMKRTRRARLRPAEA